MIHLGQICADELPSIGQPEETCAEDEPSPAAQAGKTYGGINRYVCGVHIRRMTSNRLLLAASLIHGRSAARAVVARGDRHVTRDNRTRIEIWPGPQNSASDFEAEAA